MDHQEITALYEKYGCMVMRRCMQLLKDEGQAQDALQDVFIQFFNRRLDLTSEFPSSLLYRMATNHCLNLIRDNRRRLLRYDEWIGQVARWSDPSPGFEARSLLDFLFRRHEESTRTMAVLHFYDGMTLEEVAREMGLSLSGVRKRLRKLKSSLEAIRE